MEFHLVEDLILTALSVHIKWKIYMRIPLSLKYVSMCRICLMKLKTSSLDSISLMHIIFNKCRFLEDDWVEGDGWDWDPASFVLMNAFGQVDVILQKDTKASVKYQMSMSQPYKYFVSVGVNVMLIIFIIITHSS